MDPPIPAYAGDEPYIFVSYSHRDAARVYPEFLRLHRLGHNIWYDEGIRPGERWMDTLASRLDGAAAFLFFATPDAVASEHCRNEVDYALARGCRILVVHLLPAKFPGGLALALNPRQAILRHRLSEADYERALASTLAALLGNEPTGVSAPTAIVADRTRAESKPAGVVSVDSARRVRVARGSPLLGRESELCRLDACFERARRGDGGVVILEAGAGFGKTRLVDEFVERRRQAGDVFHFLFGSYPPANSAGAAEALRAAFRDHLGDTNLEAELARRLPEADRFNGALAAALRGLPAPDGAPALDQSALQSLQLRLLQAIAAEAPTVLLLDDLHFMPEEGWSMLTALTVSIPGHRILLVGTTRPPVRAQWLAECGRYEHVEHLALDGLPREDMDRLIQSTLGSQEIATDLQRRITERSDGNPYFAIELLHSLKGAGTLVQDLSGTWTVRGNDGLRIPDTILRLVEARVALLDEANRERLEVASCYGYVFDPVPVAAALGAPVAATVRAFSAIEREHGLVRADGAGFAFDHHQSQEALYAQLPQSLARCYHAALAAALEARDPTSAGEAAVAVCDQWLRAADPAGVGRWLDPAIQHLSSQYRHQAVVDFADGALALEGAVPMEGQLDVLFTKAQSEERLGRVSAELETLGRAEALAARLRDTENDALARLLSADALGRSARLEAAIAKAVEAGAFAEQHGLRRFRRGAFEVIGIARCKSSDLPGALEAFEAALALADSELHTTVEQGNIGYVLGLLGRSQEAVRVLQAALRCTQAKAPESRNHAACLGNLGEAYLRLGRFDEALRLHQENLGVARRIGSRESEGHALANLGRVHRAVGRFGEAIADFRAALRSMREIGDREGEAITLCALAELLLLLGDGKAAATAVEESRTLCRSHGFALTDVRTVLVLAEMSRRGGNSAEAAKRFDDALSGFRALEVLEGIAQCRLAQGKILLATGSPAAAAEALDEAAATAMRAELPSIEVLALAHRARLGHGVGEAAEALARFHDRVAGPERLEAYHCLARSTGDPSYAEKGAELEAMLLAAAPDAYRSSLRDALRMGWDSHGIEKSRGARP